MAYYIGRVYLFAIRCGINLDNIRFRQHTKNEMAHYANECWDLECLTSNGWIECVGIADRCDYDLKQHSKYSGEIFSCEKEFDSKEISF
jgi:glycyl-tRNA synthetase